MALTIWHLFLLFTHNLVVKHIKTVLPDITPLSKTVLLTGTSSKEIPKCQPLERGIMVKWEGKRWWSIRWQTTGEPQNIYLSITENFLAPYWPPRPQYPAEGAELWGDCEQFEGFHTHCCHLGLKQNDQHKVQDTNVSNLLPVGSRRKWSLEGGCAWLRYFGRIPSRGE